MTMTAPVPDFEKELQQRVTMFHAGDELYSGAWLADFQKLGPTAWQICTEKLRMGPLPSLLAAFLGLHGRFIDMLRHSSAKPCRL